MCAKGVFISYRNTLDNEVYKNKELLFQLRTCIQHDAPKYKQIFLPPRVIPQGTLFSPYSLGDFIHQTFLLIDDCDKFCILDRDYFTETGELTSIWTEAEFFIWSYYDRSMFLSKHKNKDSYYTIAHPIEGGFNYTHLPLIKLTNFQRTMLRRCALDFDSQGRLPMDLPYLKTAKRLMLICNNCDRKYLVNKKSVPRKGEGSYVCSCGNVFHLCVKEEVEEEYVVCRQEIAPPLEKGISIFQAISLLFGADQDFIKIDVVNSQEA